VTFCAPPAPWPAVSAVRVGHAESGKPDGGGIKLEHAEITQKGELFQLSGNFDMQLSATLENALVRGVCS
jgi:hypothetical protein